jgi:hypothetical protein
MKRYLLLAIGVPLTALPASFAAVEGRSIGRARAIYSREPSGEVLVTGKDTYTPYDRKGRGTTICRVTMQAPLGTVTRRVRREEYETAVVGTRTPWYADPVGGEGLSEVERGYRTAEAGYGALLGLALLLPVILARGAWQGVPGGAAEGRVRKGGLPAGETRDLSLPRPPRDPAPWEAWLRRKYPPIRFLLGPPLGLSILVAVGAVALHGPEVVVALGVHQALLAWTVIFASVRGRRRDRALWERGEERHAEVLDAKRKGNVLRYEVGYEFGGETFTLRQRMPVEGEAQRGPKNRIVVLVDPLRPRRATVAPRLGV